MPADALAIIPARGGSKRVPRKNLRTVGGEPLVVRAIHAAEAAATIGRTIVSTDDAEIAGVARAEGVEVVDRPAELAADETSTEDVLLHVLDVLAERGEPVPAYVVTVEPTSPLRTPGLLDACVELAVARDADSVVTAVETRDLYGRLDGDRYTFLDPVRRPRTEREPLYREAGIAFVTRTAWLREHRSVTGGRLYAVVVPEARAVDVNTELDLVLAEAALAALEGGSIDA